MREAILLGVLLGGVAAAQQTPGLHHRSDAPSTVDTAPTVATGHTYLPPTAEGQYTWGKNGEAVTIYFENGKLLGYLAKHLEPGDTASPPETLDFATTHISGHALQFTTRQVHGTTFSFDGHLERGVAQSPEQPGFYLLTGTMTEHAGPGDDLHWTLSLQREPGT